MDGDDDQNDNQKQYRPLQNTVYEFVAQQNSNLVTFENAYSSRFNHRKVASSITISPKGSHPATAHTNQSKRSSNKREVAALLLPSPPLDHDALIETAAQHEFSGLKPIDYDISLFNDDQTLKNLKKLMIQDQNRFNSDQLDFLGNKGSYDFGRIKPQTF